MGGEILINEGDNSFPVQAETKQAELLPFFFFLDTIFFQNYNQCYIIKVKLFHQACYVSCFKN